MDSLIILCAKYLIIVPPLVALYVAYRQRAHIRGFALLSAIALPLTYIVAKVGSFIYYDPRPFVTDHVVPLIPHAADNGFPSDHTLLAASFASVISVYDRRAGALAWGATVLIGASRLAAGIHHAADILGSIVIALAVSIGVAYVLRHRKWLKNEDDFMIHS